MGQTRVHAVTGLPLAAAILFCPLAMAASDLSSQEIQGRALFLTGRVDEPAPYAEVGAGDVQVPATSVPCASCHGRDGRGHAGGAGRPPDITWSALSTPAATPGRQRQAYSETSVIRAITMGIDADGHRLDPLMPRFRLSMTDAAALLAYIRRLGTMPEPGLDGHSLGVATVLTGQDAAVERALAAYLDKINQSGGVFGRRLVLHAVRPASAEPSGRDIVRLTQSGAVFLLLSPVITGDEHDAVTAAEADGVPMIAPVTPRTKAVPRSRYVFYLDGGVEAEARALAVFAGTLPGHALVADDGSAVWHAAAATAAATLSADGNSHEPSRPDDPALSTATGPVLWFADKLPNIRDLGAAASLLLLPGALAGEALSQAAQARTWLAFTAGPPDVTADAAAEMRELAATYDLPRDDQPAQRRAIAAAKITVEALRRAGREVTRERLVDAMEGLQDFHTGLIPPVSYSTTRRIGTDGVWIVPLNGGNPIWWNR